MNLLNQYASSVERTDKLITQCKNELNENKKSQRLNKKRKNVAYAIKGQVYLPGEPRVRLTKMQTQESEDPETPAISPLVESDDEDEESCGFVSAAHIVKSTYYVPPKERIYETPEKNCKSNNVAGVAKVPYTQR